MKKLLSLIFALLLVIGFSGISLAQEEEPAADPAPEGIMALEDEAADEGVAEEEGEGAEGEEAEDAEDGDEGGEGDEEAAEDTTDEGEVS